MCVTVLDDICLLNNRDACLVQTESYQEEGPLTFLHFFINSSCVLCRCKADNQSSALEKRCANSVTSAIVA